MNQIEQKINTINKILIEDTNISKSNNGLFHGNMGLAIYAFNLARRTKDPVHIAYAETLIDVIYANLKTNSSCDFEFGLVGIAVGLNYLLKYNFVEGNTYDILQEIDDRIFQHVNFKNDKETDISNLIEIGLYLIDRLSNKSEDGKFYFFHEEMIILIINKLSSEIMANFIFFKDPAIFDLKWQLPNLLIFLSKTLDYNLYNSKILKFIDELIPNIASLLPQLGANRIHLLGAVRELLKNNPNEILLEYTEILKKNISIPSIIQREFKNKSINLQYGIAGFYSLLVSIHYDEDISNNIVCDNIIISKILDSTFWESPIEKYTLSRHLGLANGICGIGLILMMIESKQNLLIKEKLFYYE